MTPPQVVVVGSFVQDLCFRCPAFPRPGETLTGRFADGPGGKGSNQAVAAARAGAPTLFVGAIGDDTFGRGAQAFYAAEGIAAHWAVKSRHATGTAGILVDAAGQNQIIVSLDANHHLTAADLPAPALAAARIVIGQLESNLAATAKALKLGRAAGAITVLNPAPMRPDFDPALLRHVDILIPNESEFVALINRLAPPAGRALTTTALLKRSPAQLHALCGRLGVPVVIVTLGDRGVLISRQDGYLEVPAFAVEAVDTTGAGDAFVGGFAAGLLRHEGDLAAAARHGCAVAALSVTRPGTAPSMPTAAAVTRFLRRAS